MTMPNPTASEDSESADKVLAIIRDFPPAAAMPFLLRKLSIIIPSVKIWWDHRTWFVHYEANPRSLEYMALAAPAPILLAFPECRLDMAVISNDRQTTTDESRIGFSTIHELPDDDRALRHILSETKYRAAIFLYRDAIGIGWGETEKTVRSASLPQFTLNGRGRWFAHTISIRRKLLLRRVLSVSRLPEIFFAAGIFVIAAILAIKDSARGRK